MSSRAACRPKVVELMRAACAAGRAASAGGSAPATRSSTCRTSAAVTRALVRRLVEQARGHVLAARPPRGRRRAGDSARRYGSPRVALLEIGHVRRAAAGAPRARRSAPAGGGQRRPLTLSRRASSCSERRCRSTASPRCRRSVSAVSRRHHRRIAVAIAADPRRQREPRGRREPGRGSARASAASRSAAMRGSASQKTVVHEVEAGAHLVGDRGPRGARPVGEPERGDLGPERGQALASRSRGSRSGSCEAAQHLADPLELREHGAALGLGRDARSAPARCAASRSSVAIRSASTPRRLQRARPPRRWTRRSAPGAARARARAGPGCGAPPRPG